MFSINSLDDSAWIVLGRFSAKNSIVNLVNESRCSSILSVSKNSSIKSNSLCVAYAAISFFIFSVFMFCISFHVRFSMSVSTAGDFDPSISLCNDVTGTLSVRRRLDGEGGTGVTMARFLSSMLLSTGGMESSSSSLSMSDDVGDKSSFSDWMQSSIAKISLRKIVASRFL